MKGADTLGPTAKLHGWAKCGEGVQVGTDPIDLLSDREQEVLSMFSRGMVTKTIASELEISLHTVKTHARTIYRKLGVTNRVQAVLLYQESSGRAGDSD